MNETPAINNDNIRKALELAGHHLYAYAKETIVAYDQRKWEQAEKKHFAGDISDAVGTILNNWDSGFHQNHPVRAKDYLRDIRELRNKWAHPTCDVEFSRADAFRLFDSIERLFVELRIDASATINSIDEYKSELLSAPQLGVFSDSIVMPSFNDAREESESDLSHVQADDANARRERPSKLTAVGIAVTLTAAVAVWRLAVETVPAPPASPVAKAPALILSTPKPKPSQPTRSARIPRRETAEDARQAGMRFYRQGEAHFLRTGDLHARDVIFYQAIASFERARRLAPSAPEPVFNQAVVLESMNRRVDALPLFEKVISLSGQRSTYIRSKSISSVSRISRLLGKRNASAHK